MFEKSEMLYLYVETPLHAGSGGSVGLVDLPIQRERITGYPVVQAPGIKGKLRAEAKEKGATDEQIKVVFGPENADHAGALSPGDARLLLFPVRSLVGVFAWTTSRNVLARFKRDVEAIRATYKQGETLPQWLQELTWQLPGEPNENEAFVTQNSEVIPNTATQKVVLEEFAFTPSRDSSIQQNVSAIADWLAKYAMPKGPGYDDYFGPKVKAKLVILPQDVFRDFTQFATEVVTRIKIDQTTRTAAGQALWSEEHLPSDTLLYAPLHATRPRTDNTPNNLKTADDVVNFVRNLNLDRVQLGGDETVGRGIVKLKFGGS